MANVAVDVQLVPNLTQGAPVTTCPTSRPCFANRILAGHRFRGGLPKCRPVSLLIGEIVAIADPALIVSGARLPADRGKRLIAKVSQEERPRRGNALPSPRLELSSPPAYAAVIGAATFPSKNTSFAESAVPRTHSRPESCFDGFPDSAPKKPNEVPPFMRSPRWA